MMTNFFYTKLITDRSLSDTASSVRKRPIRVFHFKCPFMIRTLDIEMHELLTIFRYFEYMIKPIDIMIGRRKVNTNIVFIKRPSCQKS